MDYPYLFSIYHFFTLLSESLSNSTILCPHGNCATTCCTNSLSGYSAANFAIYLRFLTEYPLNSGNSSFKYLQNVFTTINPSEQGLSLALCVTEGALDGKDCAWRVHGGGFAGTMQAFVREKDAEGFRDFINSAFGEGKCMILKVRLDGAIKLA